MIALLLAAALMQTPATPNPATAQADFFARLAQGLEEKRLSFAEFSRASWPIVEPARPYLHNWHLDAISEHLEAVRLGQITRLIVNGPPRLGKSIPISVQFPAWLWTERPYLRVIGASYADPLATKHNVDRRDVIKSEWYQANWGRKFQLTGDQNLKHEFTNTQRGHMIARGTGAGITGYGADLIICDDLLNPKLAESDAARQAGIDYFDGTLYSRLDDKKNGVIIVNEQRLHAKDLTGHVLKNGEEWVHLVLPSEETARRVIILPISKREVVREQGAVLWEAREDKATLAKVKTATGSRRYGSQYLQAPVEDAGKLLKRHWWKFYEELPHKIDERGQRVPVTFDELIQSWDMAFKDLESSDYVVGQVWGRVGANYYLIDQTRDQLSFSETVKAFRALTAKWPRAHAKIVEDKANGPAVINSLEKEIGGIIAVTPEGGKFARACAAEPYLEAGNIFLPTPEKASWVDDFISECAAFPEGDHDDQVDAFSQAMARFTSEDGQAPKLTVF